MTKNRLMNGAGEKKVSMERRKSKSRIFGKTYVLRPSRGSRLHITDERTRVRTGCGDRSPHLHIIWVELHQLPCDALRSEEGGVPHRVVTHGNDFSRSSTQVKRITHKGVTSLTYTSSLPLQRTFAPIPSMHSNRCQRVSSHKCRMNPF